jgi:hypothetical protein
VVYYDQGGVCYATYKQKARGYYLSATPIEEEDRGNGITVRKLGLFSGICTLLEPTARFNARKLEEAAAKAKVLPLYEKLIGEVAAKNNLTRPAPVAAAA